MKDIGAAMTGALQEQKARDLRSIGMIDDEVRAEAHRFTDLAIECGDHLDVVDLRVIERDGPIGSVCAVCGARVAPGTRTPTEVS